MLEFGTSRIRWLNVAQVRDVDLIANRVLSWYQNDDSSRDTMSMKMVGSLNLMWVGGITKGKYRPAG